MSESFKIRVGTRDDAAACAAIYTRYVVETPYTFEVSVPGPEDIAQRIDNANALYAWLVLEEQGQVVGFAYGSRFSPRAAYAWTVEGSIYLDGAHHGAGRGRALYAELIRRMQARGYRRFIGVVVQPNEPSMRLHRSLGCTDVGTLHKVGWKDGAWHDVAYLELDLAPDDAGSAPSAITPG